MATRGLIGAYYPPTSIVRILISYVVICLSGSRVSALIRHFYRAAPATPARRPILAESHRTGAHLCRLVAV